MQYVESVPAVLDDSGRERRLGEEREDRCAIGARECAGADHEHRLDGAFRHFVGGLRECLRSRSEVAIFVSEIGLRADDANWRAALQPTPADARVEHRRFVTRVRSNDE